MADSRGSLVSEVVLVVLITVHIVCCPFTKVEESFNLQATHDLLYHGSDLSKYDHREFPGVVPRSFIGPLVLALLSSPAVTVLKLLNAPKLYSQYAVRAVLGLMTLYAFVKYKRAVSKKFGSTVGHLLVLITSTQFHFLFYASRPLPNTFALCLVLLALHHLLLRNHSQFIWTSAFAIIIFRTELCILLGLLFLIELGTRRLTFCKALLHSVGAGVTGLGLTVCIDSIFWQRWLWPEGEVFYFNAVLNKSSQWGTSPFPWYFYSVLPRALLCAIFLVPIGLWRDRRTWTLAGPALLFVVMFSFLPHKELRFIVYVFPVFNTVAACGLFFIVQNYCKWRRFISLTVLLASLACLVFNSLASIGFLYISNHNYPGGVAMQRVHHLTPSNPVNMHICVAAAETGVSRFGEVNSKWRYSKAENISVDSREMLAFTHLLAEAPCSHFYQTHVLLDVVPGFTRVSLSLRDAPLVIQVHTEPKICILKRKSQITT
ncbi:predicted protein [Nematostella vectensis]|uniref:Mannosyltransferase n=1 Tax=Nematostella vectensis TaxID=45351 RepID=A7RIR3_NEMVE|nr:predicted protein [Nematostella vectensis]|eukprot:XP_001640825.1 predicted protein [Nematostella vectensis]